METTPRFQEGHFHFPLVLPVIIYNHNQNTPPYYNNTHYNNTLTMRIALTMAMALAALSPALAEPLYEPAGAVLGNANTVAQMSPKVVLGYLSNCSNMSDVMEIPENADCLFDNFIRQQFPGPTFGDVCSAPDIDLDDIAFKLQAANFLCPDDFSDFIDTAAAMVVQVFEAESCWASLCDQDDDVQLRIESNFIETCSGVDLPYPSESVFDMFMSGEAEDDAILTCMLDHVMNTPATEFGFNDPPVQCWPPAYDNIGAICLDSLAQPAYDKCTSNTAFFKTLEEDMMYMSMDMSMSMKTDDDDDGGDDLMLLERFCSILDGLTTEKGLECLDIICINDMSESPSGMPSDAPSMSPSDSPSAAPSMSPSDSPSAAPSESPSFSPSAAPSSAPSESPSASPTLEDLQKIIEVELVARFSLNMSTSNVPDLLDETVEESIMDSLTSGFNDITATILTVGGNPVRRRLQNSVAVEFSVQATEECHLSDCATLAMNLIAALNNALASAVADGSMTMYIQEEAAAKSVDGLTSANVIVTSYQLVRSDYELNDPVIISNPETAQSAAVVLTCSLTSLAFLIVPFLAF
jgi:hypothetical protein